jgi:hypothetical protein
MISHYVIAQVILLTNREKEIIFKHSMAQWNFQYSPTLLSYIKGVFDIHMKTKSV